MEAYTINLCLGISNLLCGGVFIALARPLIAGRVARNDYYGMRFKKAFESEENWIQINKVGGLLMQRWGKIILVIGVVCFAYPPLSPTGIGIWFFGLTPTLVLVGCWQTYQFTKRL